MTRLARWLRLQPGEGAPVAILVGWYFCAIGVTFVLRAVRDALFLSHLSADALPAMYVIAPAASTGIGVLYAQLDGRLPRERFVVGTSAVLAALLVGLRAAIGTGAGNWIYYVLYILGETVGTIVVLQLWTVAADRFTARDAKRIFGLIGAGGTTAGIVFGAALAGLSTQLPAEDLLYACAALLAIAIALARALRRRSPAASPSARMSVARVLTPTPKTGGTAHLRLVGIALVCMVFVTTLVDYQFKAITSASFGTDRAAMVAFFGKVSIINGIVALAVQLVAIRIALAQLGVVGVLFVLPVGLAGGEVALAIAPTLAIATLLKSTDQTLRYTLNDAASQLLFLPVPSQVRGRWKAMIDNVWRPLASLVLGVFVMGYRALAIESIAPLVGAALAMAVVWVVAVGRLRGAYARALRDTLRVRPPGLDDAIDVVPREELRTIHQSLASDDPIDVLAALELADPRRTEITAAIAALCAHADARVRRAACSALAIPQSSARAAVAACVDDADPAVADAALGALLVIDNTTQLQDRDALRVCNALEIAGAAWHRAGLPPSPAAIARVAAALGGPPKGPLFAAALDAATALAAPALLGHLLAAIGAASTTSAISLRSKSPAEAEAAAIVRLDLAPAIAACARGHEALLEPHVVHPQVIRALGLLATPAAVHLLVELAGEPLPDQRLRTMIARALGRAVQRTAAVLAPADRTLVRAALERELGDAYRMMAAATALGATRESVPFLPAAPEGAAGILVRTLRDRQTLHRERAFALATALYPTAGLDAVFANLREPSATRRANALELLDSVLDRELRAALVPLAADDASKLAEVAARFAVPDHDPAAWLAELLRDRSPWLLACAAYYAGVHRIESVQPRLVELARYPDVMVREAATLATEHLRA